MYLRENFWLCHNHLPDYTPRLLGIDTDCLRDAIDDALRMTPAIFYAGEIRDRSAWRELARLAQSHLVAVTTHSSSIVNTFSLLRDCLRVHTPAQRSELASSVLSIVHMRAGKLEISPGKNTEYVLPACWVRTPTSVTGLASDGLASIVPHFVDLELEPAPAGVSCIGRRAFAKVFSGYARRGDSIVRPSHQFKWKSIVDKPFPPGEDCIAALQSFLHDQSPESWTENVACERKHFISSQDATRLQEYAATWDIRGE